MGSERTTRPNVELPVDDGAIEQALSRLDAKLSAWLDALRAAEGTVGQPASAVAEADAAPDVIPDAEPAAAPVDEPEIPVEPEAAVEPQAAPVAPKPVGLVTPMLLKDKEPAPVEEPPPPAAATEEDEALLAALDERTRSAVLIRRRLYGKRKSVRELLDDISRLGPARDEAKPQSTRWWRRRPS